MFAAAMIFSAPNVECSIYSTCKRISQKLLRNVQMFLNYIFRNLDIKPFKVIRANMEELVLLGPEGPFDRRVINSYPSKVMQSVTFLLLFYIQVLALLLFTLLFQQHDKIVHIIRVQTKSMIHTIVRFERVCKPNLWIKFVPLIAITQ